MADEYVYTIEADGEEDEVTVPADAVDLLADDETPAEVGGDLVMLGLAQQVHASVHHAEGEPDDALQQAEDGMMQAFEDRFGLSFQQMTGHDH